MAYLLITRFISRALRYGFFVSRKTWKFSDRGKCFKSNSVAGKAVGKAIGAVPLVKKSPVDEFLQNKGNLLQKNAIGMERRAVEQFSALGNPQTGVFEDKLADLIQIYNHTSQICIDKEKIYLISENEKS